MYVIVCGVDSGEITVLGPFETYNDALAYGEKNFGPIKEPDVDYLIQKVYKPKG